MMQEALLSFDVEDWFQLTGRRFGMSPGRVTRGRLQSQLSVILDLLSAHGARATFFVLGMTAESCPEAIAEIAARGHEIASHGFGHELVRTLDPARFRSDLERSLDVLGAICKQRPTGYRAPEFSIDRDSFWAFDVLLDAGFEYDSSVFPFRGPRYGIEESPLTLHRIVAPSGREIREIPLAVLQLFGKRIPVAGGGYWRLLPSPALNWAVQRIARERPPMLYFHPAEFDVRTLNPPLRTLGISTFTLKQNLGRKSVHDKVLRLLTTTRCIGAAEFLARVDTERASAAE